MPTSSKLFANHASPPRVEPHDWSSIVGIVTAIVGNILISFALNTQRYAHIRIDREYKEKHNSDARKTSKALHTKFRDYGAAAEQEQVAEERQRVNENAEAPREINGYSDQSTSAITNGKRHDEHETLLDEHKDHDQDEEDHGRRSYLTSPWWWLGIILMTIGETGNFLAYGFAPASIVSPLGVVALISNCLIAPLMLKERFRPRDFWGVLIAIAGAVTVVLSAKTNEKKLGPHGLWADIKRWEFLAYVLITAVFILALMVASPKYGQQSILIDLGLVGLFGGYTALSTKGVASLLSASLYKAFEYPIFYVLVLTLVTSAIMQIRYLNRALQNFDSTQVIPVQFVLFTLSVIIGSAVLYRDFERTDLDHVLKFVFGCLLTFGGVYLITSGRQHDESDDDHQDTSEDEAEQIHLLDEEAQDDLRSPAKERSAAVEHATANHTMSSQPALSTSSSTVPSIAVTPAASTDDLNKNPWASSTEQLARAKSNHSARPSTPPTQILAQASSSQTPFFTPHTSSRERIDRTLSSPAQPETPYKRARSPPKAGLEEPMSSKRASIARLLPGPILQPLSSSLSGIVADRILRGEGTPIANRLSLRRHRSNREANRLRLAPGGLNPDDLEAGSPIAFASESSLHRTKDLRNIQAAANGEESPLLTRTGSHEVSGSGSGSLKKSQGRLRSMSETLTNLMAGRGTRPGDNGVAEHASPKR